MALMVSPVLCSSGTSTARKTMLKKICCIVSCCSKPKSCIYNLVTAETFILILVFINFTSLQRLFSEIQIYIYRHIYTVTHTYTYLHYIRSIYNIHNIYNIEIVTLSLPVTQQLVLGSFVFVTRVIGVLAIHSCVNKTDFSGYSVIHLQNTGQVREK